MNWRAHVAFALMIAATGCAASNRLHRLDYALSDQPEHRRVEVRYRNNGQRGVCLLPEHWPNQGGKVDQNGDTVFLTVEGRSFPLAPFNTGYCFGGCATYVAPGGEIVGYISYRDFRLPQELEARSKKLELPALGFACTKPKVP